MLRRRPRDTGSRPVLGDSDGWPRTTGRLARAERDDFRSGDASVGRERRIRPLRPGARQSIRVSAVIRNPGPEERLLLVAEPRWFPGGRAEPVTMGSIPLGE